MLIFGGLLFGLGLWFGGRRNAPLPTPAAGDDGAAEVVEGPAEPGIPITEASEADLPEGSESAARSPGLVALVIDDLGRSVSDLDRLAALGIPVSYAVLPFEERTPAVVQWLREKDEEYLLHLPMQGAPGADPGPGALLANMSLAQLRTATAAALAAVPGAAGVNNHMGSVLSADERAMAEVMSVLAGENVYFLDSRTTAQTRAYDAALEAGVPVARRQVFLDGDLDPEVVRSRFLETLEIASQQGAAVAIGHPHAVTLDLLTTEVPKAVALGYRFVPVSFLLERPVGEPAG